MLFTDTSSLVYKIFIEELYTGLFVDCEFFDLSEYNLDSGWYNNNENKVITRIDNESGYFIVMSLLGYDLICIH